MNNSNDKAIDVLNDLLQTSRDGELGFRSLAGHTTTSGARDWLLHRAETCAQGARELQAAIIRLGGKPAEAGTVAGTLHRGWAAIKTAFTKDDDLAVMEEAERGEDHAVAQYRKALAQPELPADVHALIQRQAEGAQKNHHEVKRQRDALKASAA